MSENGQRYLGDVVFEALGALPWFREEARKLIEADWKSGTADFRRMVAPLADSVMATPEFDEVETWGDLNLSYIEGRVMEGAITRDRDPWLWTYRKLIGACVDPSIAREALNRIKEGK